MALLLGTPAEVVGAGRTSLYDAALNETPAVDASPDNTIHMLLVNTTGVAAATYRPLCATASPAIGSRLSARASIRRPSRISTVRPSSIVAR